MFQPGEIVLAAFPFTSPTGSIRRPCLILASGDNADDFVVAFITTTLASAQLPSATVVSPNHPAWKQSGLKTASVIRVDKLLTLNSSVFSGAIGILPPGVLGAVRSKLKLLLQIP